MNRPYVVCHMTISIDGKVTGSFLSHRKYQSAIEDYFQINRDYHADAFACGRVTMEDSFTDGWYPDLTPFEAIPSLRMDYIADEEAKFWAVAFDRTGRLGWNTSHIVDDDPGYNGAHIVEILSEHVSTAYLAYLRRLGISYLFAGEDGSDLPLALEKLRRYFGIKTLLLEGGSILNGAFERAGLIDELSLVVAPVLANQEDQPLFSGSQLQSYELREAKRLTGSALWLNYLRKPD